MTGNYPKVSLEIYSGFTLTDVETVSQTVVNGLAAILLICNCVIIPYASRHGRQHTVHMTRANLFISEVCRN